jgi:protein-S-isoprenylcysteine O-methyltransferase Ste14
MDIGDVQRVRKAAIGIGTLAGLVVFAVTNSYSPSGSDIHELVEWIGIVLIVVCILGRTWSSLYISGRKISELVEVGPYSIVRNPLYTFSILGAAGAGMQTGSVAVGIVFGGLAWAVFYMVTLREEKLLLQIHGAAYANFRARIPRFIPDVRLWRDVQTLTITPPRVAATFADAMVFLVSVPLAEIFELLQETGKLPILLVLP